MRTLAVPTSREALLDPGWLTGALTDLGDGEIVGVEAVDTSKTLAEKLRFSVDVRLPSGVVETRAYCAKAHLDGSPGGDIVAEALFYSDLAPQLDLRMPKVSYAAADGAERAIIVMEDVVANGGRFLNAHTPYDLETTHQTLDQLALLHAATWGAAVAEQPPWLGPRVGSMASRYPAEQLQALLDDGRGPDIAPELRDAQNLLEAMNRQAAHEVTCVLHGDTHSGNSYIDVGGRSCWLDWQIVQLGHWSTDVSYHLGSVLDVDDRRAHEAELLAHYLRRLNYHGGPALDWDEAWDQYATGFTYGYFLWVITQISSRAVVLVHIPRLAAALADHQTYSRLGVL